MKNERLLDALEKIDEELIEEAAPGNKPPKKKTKNMVWMKWGAMAACALVIIGIGAPLLFNHDGAITGGKPEEPELEGNFDTTSDGKVQDEAGVGETDLVTLDNMQEIRVRIDEMFPDGFRGTIEVGSDDFKEGEQITVVAQDNVTVVQKDGNIFDYDELEPNIKESDLEVGNSVWVGFQKFDYVVGNGKYNEIFAYHLEINEEKDYQYLVTTIVINDMEEPLEVALPMLSEDNRTSMSSEELYEYYGVNLDDAISDISNYVEREGGYPKGIYTFMDGSIFDMNQFAFCESSGEYELYVSIGKETKCSKLLSNLAENAKSSKINGTDMLLFKVESATEVLYYATFEFEGCDYIISGVNVEEDVFVKILETITK